MKKLALAAIAAIGLVGTADAAIVSLQGIAANGPNGFTFTYETTLGPDEGVRTGDRFIIFDFNGYIAGSIFSNSANLIASVQNLSAGAIVTPGFNDNPNVANLVFTYTGPDFRTDTGPLPPFSFPSIGARSAFGGRIADAFFTLTTQNNPSADRNKPIFTLGQVSVPTATVPEPATWAMMISGFGLAGFAARRRSRTVAIAA